MGLPPIVHACLGIIPPHKIGPQLMCSPRALSSDAAGRLQGRCRDAPEGAGSRLLLARVHCESRGSANKLRTLSTVVKPSKFKIQDKMLSRAVVAAQNQVLRPRMSRRVRVTFVINFDCETWRVVIPN